MLKIKNKIQAVLVLFAFIIAVAAGVLFTGNSSFSAARAEEEFTVTVERGTGGGTYAGGETATVTAALAEGYVFRGWLNASGTVVSTDNPYSFSVSADITLKAGAENSEVNPFVIRNMADMQKAGNTSYTGVDSLGDRAAYTAAGYYVLNSDISITSTYAPNDTFFYGHFDGKGHTVTYTSVSALKPTAGNFGLFRRVGSAGTPATIKNVTLKDFKIEAGTVDYIGALVGTTFLATIENCHIDGGTITGKQYVGGLTGTTYGGTEVFNCSSSAEVAGTVASDGYGTGGLIGYANNLSAVKYSYSTGNVTTTGTGGGLIGRMGIVTIENCYSTGDVNVTNGFAGGLVGELRDTTAAAVAVPYIKNCYAAGNVLCATSPSNLYNGAGGLIGRVLIGSLDNQLYIEKSYVAAETVEYRTGGSNTGAANIGGFIGALDVPTTTSFLTRVNISDCFLTINNIITDAASKNIGTLVGYRAQAGMDTYGGKVYLTSPDGLTWNLDARITKFDDRTNFFDPATYGTGGLDFDTDTIWEIDPFKNGGFPSLRAFVDPDAETYEVTITGGEGSGVYNGNTSATATAASPLPGYRFAGWLKNDETEFVSTISPYTFTVTGDIRLTAVYELISYSISYSLGGGENGAGNPDAYTIESGEIIFADASREGYRFAGWHNGTGIVSSVPAGSTGDIMLTAQWVKQFTVTVSGGEGSGTYDQNAEATVTASWSQTGWEFGGWRKDLETEYISTQEEYTFSVTEDILLTAVYVAIDYNIYYDLDGGGNGSGNPDSYNITQRIELVDPSKSGYRFDGWHDGTGYITEIPLGSTGDKNLTAHWTKIHTVTVTGGNIDGKTEITVAHLGEITAVTEAPGAGKVFLGWYINDIKYGDELSYTFTVDNDITLEARWADTFTATIVSGVIANTEDRSITAASGSEITAMPDSRAGYMFAGWKKNAEENYISEQPELRFTLSGDVTYTAHYTLIIYTIRYDVGEDAENAAANPLSYTVESAEIVFAPAIREGYTFAGWLDFYMQPISSVPAGSTGDLSLKATWKKNFSAVIENGSINGESGTVTIFEGETVTVKANDPARGYMFSGWKKNGEADISETKKEFTLLVTGDVSYVAVYTLAQYTIIYDTAGGTNDKANPQSYTIEDDKIELKDAVRKGYRFAGWSDGQKTVTEIPAGSVGDINLTAVWEKTGGWPWWGTLLIVIGGVVLLVGGIFAFIRGRGRKSTDKK